MNEQKQKLKCSFFEPVDAERPAAQLPCVVYLHANSSSRTEGARYARLLLKAAITMFCFDFSGSGHSDGEYVSLGWWEREDVKVVVDHLRRSGRVSTIGLWGRSMGAVTALLHADRDPSIAGLVLDSPFSDINKLAEELYRKYEGAPGLMYSLGQWMIKKSIRSRAKFELDALNPMQHVSQAFIPALFIVAKDDDLVLPAHGIALHQKYAGDKNLIQVEGGHNSARPLSALNSIYIFFYNTLQIKTLLPAVAAELESLTQPHAPVQDASLPSAVSPEYLQDPGEDEDSLQQILKLSIETAKKEEEERKAKATVPPVPSVLPPKPPAPAPAPPPHPPASVPGPGSGSKSGSSPASAQNPNPVPMPKPIPKPAPSPPAKK